MRYRFAMIMKLDNRGKSDESITASVAVDLVANFRSMDAGTACRALPACSLKVILECFAQTDPGAGECPRNSPLADTGLLCDLLHGSPI